MARIGSFIQLRALCMWLYFHEGTHSVSRNPGHATVWRDPIECLSIANTLTARHSIDFDSQDSLGHEDGEPTTISIRPVKYTVVRISDVKELPCKSEPE